MGFVELATAAGFATGIIGSFLFSLRYKLDFAGRLMVVILTGAASATIGGYVAGAISRFI